MLFSFGYEALARPTLDKRELTLELEEIDGAIRYQIEIRPVDRSSSEKRYMFTSVKPKFKVNLRPGHFEMRVRAADDRGTFGDWSESSRLTVAPKAVERIQPAAGAKFFIRDDDEIGFSWTEAPGATGYRVLITNGTGAAVAEQDFSETNGKIALPAGAVYRWQVLSRYDKDLYSEASVDAAWEFTFIDHALPAPDITAHGLTGLKWKAVDRAHAVDFEFSDANIAGQERVLEKGSRAASGELKYILQERVLYRVTLMAVNPLTEAPKVRTVFFEQQNGELIVYGETRPDISERLASKSTRWFVVFKRTSNSFEGSNVQYGQRTSFEDSAGIQLKTGAISEGQLFDRRFDLSYSAFGVTTGSGSIDASLLQGNFGWRWRKNLGFKRLPLRLHFGAGYDETPEFIANASGVLALQYFRTLNWSLGLESEYAFSRKRSVGVGFALAFPFYEMQAPGPHEAMSRADLHLRYYHDFKKFTGTLGIEIQGTTIEYGGGTKVDFSNGGLCIGLLY